ncbi:MAG TPA: hypothetical protein VIH18_07990 [Candidatus Binatia bacterium]|jgi:hypothetical protein
MAKRTEAKVGTLVNVMPGAKGNMHMPRGKRTDLAHAVLVKILADMRFEPEQIVSLTGVPRSTVKDISHGHGAWSAANGPNNEVVEIVRARVIETIDSLAYGLALKAMAKLNQRMDKGASSLELITYANLLGGWLVREP